MDVAPVLRNTPGGWLATTPPDAGFPRIGVMGDTADDATARYRVERAKWLALRDAPEPVA
jgi:hypothetical protein